ncbi:MAG TPA: DUF1365 domain-containing protein [Mycobacteriales bacterium]|nr:DUF1365 domain-containing protein [Mycobacteriales bacterium]
MTASPAPALPVLPALVTGTIRHRRTEAMRYGFQHSVYQWLVDLDALPALPAWLRAFARFRSADHIGLPQRTIKDNVLDVARAEGVDLGDDARIVMLTNARVLGYVFNPLTVFWCYDRAARLVCVVAEVHNTYGQRHAYVLPAGPGPSQVRKQLYVSPFFDTAGRYDLSFELTSGRVRSTVVLYRDDAPALTATFVGRPVPAGLGAVVRALLRHPLMPHRVALLIRAHGIRLWLRRLPVHPRPSHAPSIGAKA